MIIREGKSWVYAIFAVVVLSSALGNLSQTGLNAMLVTVCEEFGISTGVGQWLTTVYMFVLGRWFRFLRIDGSLQAERFDACLYRHFYHRRIYGCVRS